jgi:hypothetical protein
MYQSMNASLYGTTGLMALPDYDRINGTCKARIESSVHY